MSFKVERFRANVKYLCDKHKVTQRDLEKIIGTGAGYISRKGKNAPGVDKIIAIAEYFGITMDSLLNEDLSMKDKNNMSLLLDFVEEVINQTKKGQILWSIDRDIVKLAHSDIPLFTYIQPLSLSDEDDDDVENPRRTYFYEGVGEFADILYRGVLENQDYFLLIKVSEEHKQGWVLYRVFYEDVQYSDEDIGWYTEHEVRCHMIYNTLHGMTRTMNDVTNRLVDSITQSTDDIYLDWETKKFLLDYLN